MIVDDFLVDNHRTFLSWWIWVNSQATWMFVTFLPDRSINDEERGDDWWWLVQKGHTLWRLFETQCFSSRLNMFTRKIDSSWKCSSLFATTTWTSNDRSKLDKTLVWAFFWQRWQSTSEWDLQVVKEADMIWNWICELYSLCRMANGLNSSFRFVPRRLLSFSTRKALPTNHVVLPQNVNAVM